MNDTGFRPGYLSAIFLLAAFLSALVVPLPGQLIGAAFLLVQLCLAARSANILRRFSLLALGGLTPWTVMFGSGSLLVCALLTLAVSFEAREIKSARSFWPILAVLASWSLIWCLRGFDGALLLQVWQGRIGPGAPDGIAALLSWLRSSPPNYLLVLVGFFRYLAFALLFGIFVKDLSARQLFAKGALCGAYIAAALTILQLVNARAGWFANQSALWNQLGRQVGSFTDANAFGIWALLWIMGAPLFLDAKPSRLSVLSIPLWLLLGFFSGSRSFVLGLGLFAACLLFRFKPRLLIWGAACLLAGILLLAAAQQANPAAFDQYLAKLPFAVERSLRTLTLPLAGAAFFSRAVFLKIAAHAWWDHPWLGVGFGNFRNIVPLYSRELGLAIGSWSDNANNFYLGILSSCGLVGLVSLALGFFGLRFRSGADFAAWRQKAALAVFLIVLLTGPHMEFDEVSIFFAWLAGSALEPRVGLGSARALGVWAAAATVLVLFFGTRPDVGFYRWELSERGALLRWSSLNAQGALNCDPLHHQARLKVRALNPDIALRPIDLELHAANSASANKMLTDGNIQVLELPCQPSAQRLAYELKVSRVWQPGLLNDGGDRRLLGVQVLE